jgi:hypothetical protein
MLCWINNLVRLKPNIALNFHYHLGPIFSYRCSDTIDMRFSIMKFMNHVLFYFSIKYGG